ncbi:MAG: amidohydrolase family protein [Candidatus Limivivens sp.]|nr:amidohydrolase family protein [Candidatus Limivivens sp.]
MVIDMYVRPGFYQEIIESQDEIEFRKKMMGWDLMSPFPMELTRKQMKFAGIDKLVLHPLDLTTKYGGWVVTNEQIRKMMDLAPDLFYGFASVDPYREDALDVLEHAFGELKLMGLMLDPGKQQFYPSDPMMDPIYQKCIEYRKPIMFNAGMSWEPNTLMKYSRPMNFEEVAVKYPELKMCLGHFGWPFTMETAALVLKYPNLYADTSMLYMDSPEQFMQDTLKKQLGEYWIEHNIHDKVMFGSGNPRFRSARIKRGLESIPWRPDVREKILGGNAVKFLGLED